MRITNLEIKNYRGILESNISFPLDSRIICLIGAGDSTKSTLLRAIEWLFWPSWSLNVSDSDFYQGDTTNPITIRGTFTEFPDRFLAEDKFGMYLRRPDVRLQEGEDDEPHDTLPLCLTIQLVIDASLDPIWEIVCNRQDPRVISHNDRRDLFVGVIGDNVSKDLSWGKYSILQKYADSKGILHDAYTAAVRDVAKNADLSALDSISKTLTDIGKKYGVSFSAEITSRLIMQVNSFSSNVGLFDGNAPLGQFGTGSQRLLSMGLSIGAASGDALLLIDEIENGLEPYRIRSIINEFRSQHSSAGQIIITTHSPVAVAECTIDELMVVHSVSGRTVAYFLKGENPDVNKTIQQQIRRNTEAFLAKRLIICEGRTEMGFIRAFDAFLNATEDFHMAYKGISTADGNGDEIFQCTDILRKCGYDLCIVMDSDKDSEDSKKQYMREIGIPVFDWMKPNALEEQCFLDIPLSAVQEAIHIAIDEKSADSIAAKLKNHGIPYTRDGDNIEISSLSDEQRRILGKVAKDSDWYKRIGRGEQFGKIVLEHGDELPAESAIRKVIAGLTKWVKQDDT